MLESFETPYVVAIPNKFLARLNAFLQVSIVLGILAAFLFLHQYEAWHEPTFDFFTRSNFIYFGGECKDTDAELPLKCASLLTTNTCDDAIAVTPVGPMIAPYVDDKSFLDYSLRSSVCRKSCKECIESPKFNDSYCNNPNMDFEQINPVAQTRYPIKNVPCRPVQAFAFEHVFRSRGSRLFLATFTQQSGFDLHEGLFGQEKLQRLPPEHLSEGWKGFVSNIEHVNFSLVHILDSNKESGPILMPRTRCLGPTGEVVRDLKGGRISVFSLSDFMDLAGVSLDDEFLDLEIYRGTKARVRHIGAKLQVNLRYFNSRPWSFNKEIECEMTVKKLRGTFGILPNFRTYTMSNDTGLVSTSWDNYGIDVSFFQTSELKYFSAQVAFIQLTASFSLLGLARLIVIVTGKHLLPKEQKQWFRRSRTGDAGAGDRFPSGSNEIAHAHANANETEIENANKRFSEDSSKPKEHAPSSSGSTLKSQILPITPPLPAVDFSDHEITSDSEPSVENKFSPGGPANTNASANPIEKKSDFAISASSDLLLLQSARGSLEDQNKQDSKFRFFSTDKAPVREDKQLAHSLSSLNAERESSMSWSNSPSYKSDVGYN